MWVRAYRDEPLPRQLPPTAAATQEARPHSNLRRLDRQYRLPQALGLTKGLHEPRWSNRCVGRLHFLEVWARPFRSNDRSEPAILEYAWPSTSWEVSRQWP